LNILQLQVAGEVVQMVLNMVIHQAAAVQEETVVRLVALEQQTLAVAVAQAALAVVVEMVAQVDRVLLLFLF
jgi:hypothetical protein